jgi:hypothetical protein
MSAEPGWSVDLAVPGTGQRIVSMEPSSIVSVFHAEWWTARALELRDIFVLTDCSSSVVDISNSGSMFGH